MTTVTLKRGYRLPKLRQQLKQADGTPVPLTGASVRLLMGIPGKPRKVAAAATILDAANGIVEYAWAAGDVDTVGVYLAEWECTFADGPLPVPNNAFLTVVVTESLQ